MLYTEQSYLYTWLDDESGGRYKQVFSFDEVALGTPFKVEDRLGSEYRFTGAYPSTVWRDKYGNRLFEQDIVQDAEGCRYVVVPGRSGWVLEPEAGGYGALPFVDEEGRLKGDTLADKVYFDPRDAVDASDPNKLWSGKTRLSDWL